MSSRLLAFTLLLLATANWAAAQSCCPAAGCCAKPADLPKNTTDDCAINIHVGQIVIVGNTQTPQNVILDQIPFYPGQIISNLDLQQAESNLARTNIFDDGSTVEVLDPDGVVPVKDILVTVREKCGAFRCGPDDDDEDQEAPKSKCSCDDCSCCGCMNKPGAECSCKECKCCGCKTADTVAVPDGGTVIIAGLKFCVLANEGQCDKDGGNCDKAKCKYDKDKCDCCDKGCGSDCASGKCEKEKCGSDGCEGKGCYEKIKIICCPCCPSCLFSLNSYSMGWLVVEEICPVVRIYTMCPWMQAQVKEVLKPCLKSIAAEYKQMLKAGKAAATPCPAEEGACEETGEPQAKKSCHGCGQSAEAGQKVHVWHLHVFPIAQMKRAAGFMFGWKCGGAEKAKEDEAACDTEKDTEPAKTVCPYLQKKAQTEKEKAVSAAELYERLGSPLENLAKLEKAQHLCKKAQSFCEAGKYDRAIKCFEKAKALCPGSRWEVKAAEGIQVAQAMKEMDEKVRTVTRELMEKLLDQVIHKEAAAAVEESEPTEQPCHEPKALREYKQRFTDLLDQARSACATGDLEMARYYAEEAASLATPEVMEKVKSLIGSARDCFNSGCTADGWEMLHQALMLDPTSAEARDLQDEMILQDVSNRCNDFDCEPCDTLPPDDEDAEPGDKDGPADPCCDDGCVRMNRRLRPGDTQVIQARENVPVELHKKYTRVPSSSVGDCEEQEALFIIDVQDEDLDLVTDKCAQCDEQTPSDLKAQVQQFLDIIRENVSVEVDCGKSQPGCARLWVQIGAVEYQATFNTNGQNFLQLKVIAPEAADNKAAQQKNSDGTITEGDSEEAEEPLYMLETDLDPNW